MSWGGGHSSSVGGNRSGREAPVPDSTHLDNFHLGKEVAAAEREVLAEL